MKKTSQKTTEFNNETLRIVNTPSPLNEEEALEADNDINLLQATMLKEDMVLPENTTELPALHKLAESLPDFSTIDYSQYTDEELEELESQFQAARNAMNSGLTPPTP